MSGVLAAVVAASAVSSYNDDPFEEEEEFAAPSADEVRCPRWLPT